jgi:hypothetical protein
LSLMGLIPQVQCFLKTVNQNHNKISDAENLSHFRSIFLRIYHSNNFARFAPIRLKFWNYVINVRGFVSKSDLRNLVAYWLR